MIQVSEHSLIRHQEIGASFEGVYYVESAYVKKTVQNKDFTDLMLRDKSGSRNVKFWGRLDGITKGCFVFISAIVQDYQGTPSIVAKNVEKADQPDDMSSFIPAYEESGPNANATKFDQIREVLNSLEKTTGNTMAGRLVDEVYKNSTFFKKFITAPGSAKTHYGCQGGLLANTVRITESALSGADSYGLKEDEQSVLIAAALLSRIGAIEAFEFDNCMPVLTKKGILLGINNLTMSRITSALKRVIADMGTEGKTVDGETVIRIMHAVTSHDGHTVQPMTKEAMVLNAAFKTDSEIVEALDFIESDVNTTEEFTAYDPATGRKYYTGTRKVTV